LVQDDVFSYTDVRKLILSYQCKKAMAQPLRLSHRSWLGEWKGVKLLREKSGIPLATVSSLPLLNPRRKCCFIEKMAGLLARASTFRTPSRFYTVDFVQSFALTVAGTASAFNRIPY